MVQRETCPLSSTHFELIMHVRSGYHRNLIQRTNSAPTSQVGSSKYVAVSGGVNDADAASAEWIKIDDAFNASEVCEGELRLR